MTELSGPVVVLAGGLSNERDVSLRSGRRIVDALREVGVEVFQRDVDAELIPALAEDLPAAVFPVVHGATGEDGAVREVLELLGVPYVGARPTACRLAFDKTIAKSVVAAAGITTPASTTLPHAAFRDLGAAAVLDRITARLKLPLVVKPARGGSALGMSVVHEATELPAAMVSCFSYGDTALVEQHIAGTEVAVGVVDTGAGPKALPPVEIVPETTSGYDYAARYTAGGTNFYCPARLDGAVIEAVQQTAMRAHVALGLRHISRSDLIVDERGEVQLLEVNVAPGMTETSTLPMAATHAGMSFGQLCRDLVTVAVASA